MADANQTFRVAGSSARLISVCLTLTRAAQDLLLIVSEMEATLVPPARGRPGPRGEQGDIGEQGDAGVQDQERG